MISEFPLFVFTLFTGLSAGVYAASVPFPELTASKRKKLLLPVCCLVLLGVGLLGALFHLGQPVRFMNALAHPSAPITMEAYCSMAFGALVLTDLVVTCVKGGSPQALRIVAAMAALALMVITGYAYFTCYGIPAWASWPTFGFFIIPNVAMGLSLLLLVRKDLASQKPFLVSNFALNALFLFELITLAFRFVQCGEGIEWIVASVIIGPVTGSATLVAANKMGASNVASIIYPALIVVATIIVRYSFYSVSSI